MLQTPLEQFQVLNITNLKLIYLDFSITNILLIILILYINLSFITFFNSVYFYKNFRSTFYISNCWQRIIELPFFVVKQIILDIIKKNNQQYFPVVLTLFNFILFNNIIGLIPYAFTITSHIIVTCFLSFSIFFAINYIGIKNHGLKIFELFLPSNSNILLAICLVPIEFVSYIAKPISLGVRLFINLMAGHILFKVIIGFSWNLLFFENLISFSFFIPILTLVILFFLELGIAFIQAYVFVVLTCIYIQDVN